MFPLFASAQTTVVIRCTKHAIYAGADSRVFKTNIDQFAGNTDTILQSMCKLYQVDKINFAVLGYFAQTAAGFGISVCRQQPVLQQAVADFIHHFGQLAADSLAVYRRYATTQFSSLQNGAIISQVIFFGYEKDRRYILQITFYLKKLNDNRFTVGYAIDSSKHNFASGHTQYIQSIMADSKTWRKPAVKTIRRLIKTEESADTLFVGGPVDILKVTAGRARWISRKEACAAGE